MYAGACALGVHWNHVYMSPVNFYNVTIVLYYLAEDVCDISVKLLNVGKRLLEHLQKFQHAKKFVFCSSVAISAPLWSCVL